MLTIKKPVPIKHVTGDHYKFIDETRQHLNKTQTVEDPEVWLSNDGHEMLGFFKLPAKEYECVRCLGFANSTDGKWKRRYAVGCILAGGNFVFDYIYDLGEFDDGIRLLNRGIRKLANKKLTKNVVNLLHEAQQLKAKAFYTQLNLLPERWIGEVISNMYDKDNNALSLYLAYAERLSRSTTILQMERSRKFFDFLLERS